MKRPEVQKIPPTVKRMFLTKKGLDEEQIGNVFRLYEESIKPEKGK